MIFLLVTLLCGSFRDDMAPFCTIIEHLPSLLPFRTVKLFPTTATLLILDATLSAIDSLSTLVRVAISIPSGSFLWPGSINIILVSRLIKIGGANEC